jgi:hypothetical protein
MTEVLKFTELVMAKTLKYLNSFLDFTMETIKLESFSSFWKSMSHNL